MNKKALTNRNMMRSFNQMKITRRNKEIQKMIKIRKKKNPTKNWQSYEKVKILI